MLMDEPFSSLMIDLGMKFEMKLSAVAEDTAVLMVTHDPQEAMKVADEIALMRMENFSKGAPYNIYNTPVDQKALQFFLMQMQFRLS